MRSLGFNLFLALTLFLVAGISAMARTNAPVPALPQLKSIHLVVRVDYESERVSGATTLVLHNPTKSPIFRVPFLLNRLMRVGSIRDRGGKSLTYAQQLTAFEDVEKWQVNSIEADLREPLSPGESLKLRIEYGGYLVGYTEVGIRYVKDHVSRDFTILREDALAFPVVGVPSLAVNRAAPRSPFDFEVSVTVPEGLVVATGGEQIGKEVADGNATWRYRSRAPAPFLLIAIAPYRIAEKDGLRVFHFTEDDEGARVVLDAAGKAAVRYSEILGPLNRELALNIIEIPDGWGSQASLTAGIIQEAGAFRDKGKLVELYHELSHLWNAPDLDGPSPRWNEGLAMFLQDRLARELDGREDNMEVWRQTAHRLLERCGDDKQCGKTPMRDFGKEGLTDHSYLVGRLMFATLFSLLGETEFDRALKQYFQAHKQEGGRVEDLVEAFVDVGGDSARMVFDDWMNTTAWRDRLRDSESMQEVFEYYRR